MVDCVKLAEDLGYESAWITEGHGGDQFAILAACAMATTRIVLGTSISSVFVRSIPTIAMAAATVDDLSQQRFILGLGSSHKVQVEPEHGVTFRHPVQRLKESVDIIRTLLRDGVVSYQGETLTIQRFDLWFTPSRPEVPIYLAGLFPTMLELCGEIAQGLLMTRSTLDAARHAAAHVAIGARRAGRRPDEIVIASLLPCSVGPSQHAACETLRPGVAFYGGFFPRYNRLMAESGFPDVAQAIRDAWNRQDLEAATRAVPDTLITAMGVVGTPTECQERLAAYRASGLTLPIISPRGPQRNDKEGTMAAIRACAP
jgi:alkanesulfonate monooxygenase SsuD/methylene tetrahydromethanopterin reductase-like flavin-dependent oxidoreductase (luciferase family)